MVGDVAHPATTPKGASAITILLGVVSVFAPFVFTVGSALMLSAIAILVIAWIYWAEMREAVAQKRWTEHLNVPLGSVLAILFMGVIAVRQEDHQPKPIPTPSADEIAKNLEARFLRDHLVAPQPTAPGTQIAAAVPPKHTPTKAPSSSGGSAPTTIQAPVVPTPPVSRVDTFDFVKLESQNAELAKRRQATLDCITDTIMASKGLYKLEVDAVNAQNDWAITKNDQKAVDSYSAWVANAHQLFEKYKGFLPNTSGFDLAPEPDSRPTFLFIHNSGYHAWNKFDAKRKALEQISAAMANKKCPPYNVDNVKADLRDGKF